MRQKKLWIGLAVALAVLFLMFRMMNSMGPFIIIPEPRFPVADDYSIDKKAMESYYTDIFKGKSASDIISFLDEHDVMYFFEGGNKIYFLVSKSFVPIPARYSGDILIQFKDGYFEKVVSFGVFGIDAL
ncbi:hypothetical protein [Thalassospira sp. TSL5-1]|uniref:hypothetical protein n=1 Tax=Thalassospira sp. TSL5-1 TaxID=1544451 RepID=UPI00093BEBB0|nr:hypothetical protein [Thalassospira sp. TSL5-1]OKH87071.1 hypothetical protein LF95_18940 [Thalassospira sp. TSL5-1]